MGVGDAAWRLTYFIECDAQQAAAELRTASPADTPQCRVFRQDFLQQNLRLDPRGRSSVQAREIVALAEGPGVCQTTLRFDLRLNPRNWTVSGSSVMLSANQRAEYLRATETIQVRSQPVIDTLARLRETGADQETMARRVFQHCRHEAVLLDEDAADDAATVLEEGRGTAVGCVRAMIALCRAATIPARPVVGFVVESGDPISPTIWLELLLGDRWVPYDPVRGYERELPFNYVPAQQRRRADCHRQSGSRSGGRICHRAITQGIPGLVRGGAGPERHSGSDAIAARYAARPVVDPADAAGCAGDVRVPQHHRLEDVGHVHAHVAGPEPGVCRLEDRTGDPLYRPDPGGRHTIPD